jgi:hypothetical protein
VHAVDLSISTVNVPSPTRHSVSILGKVLLTTVQSVYITFSFIFVLQPDKVQLLVTMSLIANDEDELNFAVGILSQLNSLFIGV